MKSFLSLSIVTLLATFSFAQKKLPILKAKQPNALFCEEDNGLKTQWNVDPKIKMDVYTVSKISAKSKIVKIKTDIDSIKIKVKKGEKKDFIILLNDKDSAFTRIESLPAKNFSKMSFKDTVKMGMNEQNTIYFKSILNKKDTLTLNFDTGTSDLVLTEETLKNKIKSSLKTGVNELELGNKIYNIANIYPAKLTGTGTEGRFGWNLFDGMIVELNYDKGIMVAHSQLPKSIDSQYDKLKIKYFNNIFLVEANISQGKNKNKDWYLFDTGYQRTAMLDEPLLVENGFQANQIPVIKKVIMRGAQGNEIPVLTSKLESLSLGKFSLKEVPVQVLKQSRLISGSRMQILGNEVLKRFNIFLDFQKNVVYIKPNDLFHETYIESK